MEEFLADTRPGWTRADILDMPFYELRIKLDIIKKREDEKETRRKAGEKQQEREAKDKYKPPKTGDMMKQAGKHMSGFKGSIPKIKSPKI